MLQLLAELMIRGKVSVCPLAATQGFPMTQRPALQLVLATPLKLLQYVSHIVGCWQQVSSSSDRFKYEFSIIKGRASHSLVL